MFNCSHLETSARTEKKVVVRYFESSADLCLLEPWLRELGFTCCYGTIVLKIYRSVEPPFFRNVSLVVCCIVILD